MKNILLTIALVSAFPVAVNAQEKMDAPEKPVVKEHHMQNSNPAPKKDQAPEHTMRNDTPSTKHAEPKPQHTMRNN